MFLPSLKVFGLYRYVFFGLDLHAMNIIDDFMKSSRLTRYGGVWLIVFYSLITLAIYC